MGISGESQGLSYVSVCSGIEAASVAWHGLGWRPLAFSEIEPFPSAVLARHWPEVPNLGDLTKYDGWPRSLQPDLVVGGTPCQSFSVAGLRKGLADPRGNLSLVFLGLLERLRPRWVVWENVPGVLSDKSGAFGAFLGGLGKLGYGFAYRVLDAQYYGVAQRRRRVFVVGYLGDWRRAGAVLFEPESLRGDSPPRREAGQTVTPTIRAGAPNGGAGHGARSGDSKDELIVPVLAHALRAQSQLSHQEDRDNLVVAHSLRGEGFDASEDGTGRGTPIVPAIAFERRMVRTSGGQPQEELNHCLRSDTNTGDGAPCVATFQQSSQAGKGTIGYDASGIAKPCKTQCDGQMIHAGPQVRRLTPVECERLQGFPDGHTAIEYRGRPACDGPRYKALGNSMAVPVMRWIGGRIAAVDGMGFFRQQNGDR